jgi:hypothetical protein
MPAYLIEKDGWMRNLHFMTVNAVVGLMATCARIIILRAYFRILRELSFNGDSFLVASLTLVKGNFTIMAIDAIGHIGHPYRFDQFAVRNLVMAIGAPVSFFDDLFMRHLCSP